MRGPDVKRLRDRLGLTQSAMGTLLGFGTPQIRVSELERGSAPVSAQVAIILRYLTRYGPL